MENKLKPCPHITDLNLLKITKVKPWSICFDYDGTHYLIHGQSECGEGSWQKLYIRELDKNGKYNLTFLKTCGNADEYVARDYIKRQRGKTIVYRNIDRDFFAYKLTKRGFATGNMEREVKLQERRIANIKKSIEVHYEKIAMLRQKIAGLE